MQNAAASNDGFRMPLPVAGDDGVDADGLTDDGRATLPLPPAAEVRCLALAARIICRMPLPVGDGGEAAEGRAMLPLPPPAEMRSPALAARDGFRMPLPVGDGREDGDGGSEKGRCPTCSVIFSTLESLAGLNN